MSEPGDCRHFNGVIGPGMRKDHRCRASVDYKTVRDASAKGPYRWPCLMRDRDKGCATECGAYEPLSALEVKADDEWIHETVDLIVSGSVCPQCCEPLTRTDTDCGSATVLTCDEHGFVARECRRVGEP